MCELFEAGYIISAFDNICLRKVEQIPCYMYVSAQL